MTPDPREATDDRFTPLGFELGELRAVDQSGDDLVGIEGNAIVGRHDAVQILRWIQRRFGLDPVEPALTLVDPALVGGLADLTQLGVGLGLGVGPIVADARHQRVEFSAAQIVGLDDLTQRRLDDWWAAQEDAADALDHDDFVGERRHVGTAGSATAQHHRELRQALGRQPSLTVEGPTEVILVGEDLVLQGQECATGVDEIDHAEFVLLGDLLCPHVLLDRHRKQGAALDRGVVGDEDVGHAVDESDTGDDACAWRRVLVLAEPAEGRELHERGALVGDHPDPISHHDLSAFEVARDASISALAPVDRPLHALGERGCERTVRLGVVGELGRVTVEFGDNRLHQSTCLS